MIGISLLAVDMAFEFGAIHDQCMEHCSKITLVSEILNIVFCVDISCWKDSERLA